MPVIEKQSDQTIPREYGLAASRHCEIRIYVRISELLKPVNGALAHLTNPRFDVKFLRSQESVGRE